VPNHHLCLALLESLGNPIISTSAHLPLYDMDDLNVDIDIHPSKMDLFDRLDSLVDIIIDTGEEPKNQVSTILDLTDDHPIITRKGMGWEAVAAWI